MNDYKKTPLWDVSLPLEKRLDYLMAELTLEEKLPGNRLSADPAPGDSGVSCRRRGSAWCAGASRSEF